MIVLNSNCKWRSKSRFVFLFFLNFWWKYQTTNLKSHYSCNFDWSLKWGFTVLNILIIVIHDQHTYNVLDSVCFCTARMLSVCLFVCLWQHNLSTNAPIFLILAFGIYLLKNLYDGKKPIENGLSPMKIVEMGGILVFFL